MALRKRLKKRHPRRLRSPNSVGATIWHGGDVMSDLQRYVQTRQTHDVEFSDGLETGYTNFKIGVLLRQAREASGLTQAEVAQRLQSPPTAISQMENHAEEARL